MNIAFLAVLGLGGLLLSLASKASANTAPAPTDETASPQLPPPEPESEASDQYGPDAYAPAPASAAAPQYALPQYAPPGPQQPAAAPQLPANHPFGDQPLEVDVPEQGEAAAAAAEEHAQASGGGGAPPPSAAAGPSLSFRKPAAKLAASTPSPTAAKPAAKRTPITAAKDLLSYVSSAIASGAAATLGTKASPNPIVKAAQIDMSITPADGIYGPATRNRGKALTGLAFPARDAPAKSVKPVAAVPKTTKAPAAASTRSTPLAKAAAVTASKPASNRTGADAARQLLTYVNAAIAQKRTLGSKASPDPVVKAAQLDMGVSPADGIYGPATRSRGKALIGSTFPAR